MDLVKYAPVLSAFAAVVSLVVSIALAWWNSCQSKKDRELTRRQIELGNQQRLFDRRLDAWEKCRGLLSMYITSSSAWKTMFVLAKGKGYLADVPGRFVALTSITFLKDIQHACEHSLDEEYDIRFHVKLEEIHTLAFELSYIFRKEQVEKLSEFTDYYARLLDAMHRFCIAKDNCEAFFCSDHHFESDKERCDGRIEALKAIGENEEIPILIDWMDALVKGIDNSGTVAGIEDDIQLSDVDSDLAEHKTDRSGHKHFLPHLLHR